MGKKININENELVHFDEFEFSQAIGAWERITPSINSTLQSFKDLIPEELFTIDTLKIVFYNRVNELRAIYSAYVDKKLETMYLPNAIKEEYKATAMKEFSGLAEQLDRVQNTIQRNRGNSYKDFGLSLNDLCVIDNEVLLSEEGKERIKLTCSYLLDTPNRKELYERAVSVTKDFNDLQKFLETHEGGNFGMFGYERVLELDQDGRMSVNPKATRLIK